MDSRKVDCERRQLPDLTAMDSERRYNEDEVSEILDRATEAQTDRSSAGPAGSAGLTLRELQEIGREVGIPGDVIARAATDLDRPRPKEATPERFLGQTIGVGRTLDLPRPLTEQEWHSLVVEMRETFGAKGKIRDEGPFRSWTNSNLQALLEPTDRGQRLRLRTMKGNARSFQGLGAGFVAVSLVMALASLVGVGGGVTDFAMMGVMGAAFFLASRLTVPTWAKTRARQFDEIIGRVAQTVALSPGREEDALPPASAEGEGG